MEKVTEEYFNRHYKPCKYYYDTYMFGESAYFYHEYCRIKECAYGEMVNLMEFGSLYEAITDPESSLLPYIPDTGDSYEQDFDQSESYVSHKAMLVYYSEYKNWCGLKNVDYKAISSYLQYLEMGGYDFL